MASYHEIRVTENLLGHLMHLSQELPGFMASLEEYFGITDIEELKSCSFSKLERITDFFDSF